MNGRQKRFSRLAPRKMCAPALATQPVPIIFTRGADKADHVVDGVARLHMAARRIDDDADVAVAFGGIGQQLRA